jgi:ATP-binding cassette, subfamily B, bacterial
MNSDPCRRHVTAREPLHSTSRRRARLEATSLINLCTLYPCLAHIREANARWRQPQPTRRSLTSMLRRLLQYYGSERRQLTVLSLVGLLTAAAEATSLVALAPLLQAVAEGRDSYSGDIGPFAFDLTIAQLAGIAAVLLVIAFLFNLVGSYASARIVASYQLRRRLELVDSFQNAHWEVQASAREGRLVMFCMDFIGQSATGLNSLSTLAQNGAGLFVFLSIALLVSWEASLVITGSGIVLALLLRPLRRRAALYAGQSAQANLNSSEEISMLSLGARDIAAYSVGRESSERFRAVSRRHRQLRIRSQVTTSLISPLFRIAGLLLIVGLIAYVAATSIMEIAALGVVVLLLYRSMAYGQTLIGTHSSLVSLEPVIDQLTEEHARYSEHRRPVGNVEIDDGHCLSLSNVSYNYPGSHREALRSITFEVKRGEVIGIVGPSGAGKSTIADLLVGLRSPTSGNARIDKYEIHDLSAKSRAHTIALVSQSVPILPATVAENVKFFRPIQDEEVVAALARVGLSPLVDEMPQGRETAIGTGSRAVSGGQAQRIGIARAIAGGTDFIVLDEPTSALDPESEQTIAELLGNLKGHAGIVIIAHRLSTLRNCDRVIVVESGTITGDDTLPNLRISNSYVRKAFELGSLDWSSPADHAASIEHIDHDHLTDTA